MSFDAGQQIFSQHTKLYLRFMLDRQGDMNIYFVASTLLIFFVMLTICECVERFASNVQSGKGRALGLGGSPAGQCSLKSWRPVADHSKGLPLYRDDLTSLGFWGVGVGLGNWR